MIEPCCANHGDQRVYPRNQASVYLTNYNTFDRFVVHGGYEYYTDDIIGDTVLFHLPAEDLLFLFQFDQLPPEEPWSIARQVVLPQLDYLTDNELAHYKQRVERWAEYIIHKRPQNPFLLATAILLAPCQTAAFETLWWGDHANLFIREAMGMWQKRCWQSASH